MTTPNEELIAALTQTNQFHESADICTEDVIAVLQSQAERIAIQDAEIERLNTEIRLQYAHDTIEIDTLRAQLPDGMKDCTILFKECVLGHGWLTATNWVQHECPTCETNKLRAQLAEQSKAADHWMTEACKSHNAAVGCEAQLAAIRAQEPVLVVEKEPDYWSGGHFHEGSKPHIKPTKVWYLPIGTQLFTRPMPAQDVAELVELLEFMWRDVSMNEYAFEKLEAALSKYKGAK